jgi:hypothetical protein
MRSKILFATILLGILVLAACESANKTAAQAAIQVAQTAYAAIADQSNQYVPDQAKDVQASIQSAKDAYDKGDYGAALEAAKGLPEKIKALASAASPKKDELTAKWKDLSTSMRGLIAAVQSKADALTKNHHLPAGAADTLASVKQSWTDASSTVSSGQIQDALAKASAAKDKLTELANKLGVKTPA